MFGIFNRHPHSRDDDLLRILIKHVFSQDERIRTMANDISKLQDAVAALETTVASLPPAEPSIQPQIDDLTGRVTALKDKLAPPVAETPAP